MCLGKLSSGHNDNGSRGGVGFGSGSYATGTQVDLGREGDQRKTWHHAFEEPWKHQDATAT